MAEFVDVMRKTVEICNNSTEKLTNFIIGILIYCEKSPENLKEVENLIMKFNEDDIENAMEDPHSICPCD